MTFPDAVTPLLRRTSLLVAVILVAHSAPLTSQVRESDVIHARLIGAMDARARRHVERAIADARSGGSAAIVIDLNTRGGSVADAQLAVSSIIETPTPVYALVNPAAWGAGALIALAADSLFMAPDASIGWGNSSEDDEEISSAALGELRSEFAVLAARRGLDNRIAMAMADPDIVIPDLVRAGERLTLSTEDAIRLGYAAGEVDDIEQLLGLMGLEEAELGVYTPNQLASGITITVENNNWRDVRINLLLGTTGSIRRNLGQVTSMNSAEFEIPIDMTTAGSRLRVVAEVIGSSERAVTEWITVQPGLAIDWVIANVISQSNYFAYIRY